MIRDSTKLSVSLSTPGPVLSNLLLQSSGDSPVWWALWTIGICPSVKDLSESSSEKASMRLSLLFPFFPLLVALEELLPPDDLPFPFPLVPYARSTWSSEDFFNAIYIDQLTTRRRRWSSAVSKRRDCLASCCPVWWAVKIWEQPSSSGEISCSFPLLSRRLLVIIVC